MLIDGTGTTSLTQASMDPWPPAPPFTALHSRPLAKGVWPPRGTALRGTTLGRHFGPDGPARYSSEYGVAGPHLYRTFRSIPAELASGTCDGQASCDEDDLQDVLELTSAEIDHLQRGGLLWYNLKCMVILDCVEGRYDGDILRAADAVAGVAPAHVIVCVNHEWDHHLSDAPADERGRCNATLYGDCATGDSMRALFGRVQRLFDEAGATNAVWVVDYSTHAGVDTHANVEATWPVHRLGYNNTQYEAARVDAVFFNSFLQAYRARKRAHSIVDLMYEAYRYHSTNPLYRHLPLGLGAWGVHDWEPSYPQIDASLSRADWEANATKGMQMLRRIADEIVRKAAAGECRDHSRDPSVAAYAWCRGKIAKKGCAGYVADICTVSCDRCDLVDQPMNQLMAMVYYDSKRSAIRSAPTKECGTCGDYPKPAAFVDAYRDLLRSPLFTALDAYVISHEQPSPPPSVPPLVPPQPPPPSYSALLLRPLSGSETATGGSLKPTLLLLSALLLLCCCVLLCSVGCVIFLTRVGRCPCRWPRWRAAIEAAAARQARTVRAGKGSTRDDSIELHDDSIVNL